MTKELWKLEKGWLAAYTESQDAMKRVKRYKPHWKIMAEYLCNGKNQALQYKIPMEERRQAERMFQTDLAEI